VEKDSSNENIGPIIAKSDYSDSDQAEASLMYLEAFMNDKVNPVPKRDARKNSFSFSRPGK